MLSDPFCLNEKMPIIYTPFTPCFSASVMSASARRSTVADVMRMGETTTHTETHTHERCERSRTLTARVAQSPVSQPALDRTRAQTHTAIGRTDTRCAHTEKVSVTHIKLHDRGDDKNQTFYTRAH